MAGMPRDILAVPPVSADRRVAYGSDPNQFVDLWNAQGTRRGAAIMIHGGFWRARYDLAHAGHLCAALAQNGIATASLEYRRVGNPGGGWPGTFDDVVAGVRAATEFFGQAPVVLGHSAGGHLALRVASEPLHIRGVVALAPVADLRLCFDLHLSNDAVVEFLGGTPAQVPATYDAACPALHAASIPRVLLHGAADDIVPLSMTRAYVAVRESDPGGVESLEIPADGHFDLIDPASAAWPVVLDAVLRAIRD